MPADKKPTKISTALTTGNSSKKPAQPGSGLVKSFGTSSKPPAGPKHVSDTSIGLIRTAQSSRPQGGDQGYLAYIVDATASRSDTWAEMQKYQNEIFKSAENIGNLHVRLIHFGGEKITDEGWHDNAGKLAKIMSKVSCQSGETQIYGALRTLLKDPQGHIPKNIILIGDCCEETDRTILPIIKELAERGIKVFSFHEKTEHDKGSGRNGQRVYRMIAEITGGVFQQLDSNINLRDLCSAVAVETAGSQKDLDLLTTASAKALSAGLKKALPPGGGYLPGPKNS